MAAVSIVALLAQMSSPRLKALFGQDPEHAAKWVFVAAAEGLAEAQVCYGRMLLEGTGLAKDPGSAFKWFRRAAAGGDLEAINMVGRCLDNGWGTIEDPAAAAECFRRAADAGHAWAQYNLGHMYLDGRGVARDLATGLRLLPQGGRTTARARDESPGALLRTGLGDAARRARCRRLVSPIRGGRLFPRTIQLGQPLARNRPHRRSG